MKRKRSIVKDLVLNLPFSPDPTPLTVLEAKKLLKIVGIEIGPLKTKLERQRLIELVEGLILQLTYKKIGEMVGPLMKVRGRRRLSRLAERLIFG